MDSVITFSDLATRLSFINSFQAVEKFQGTYSYSNVNIDIKDMQAIYRIWRFSSSPKIVSNDEECRLWARTWSRPLFHQANFYQAKKNCKLQQHMYKAGHTNKLATMSNILFNKMVWKNENACKEETIIFELSCLDLIYNK